MNCKVKGMPSRPYMFIGMHSVSIQKIAKTCMLCTSQCHQSTNFADNARIAKSNQTSLSPPFLAGYAPIGFQTPRCNILELLGQPDNG